MSSTLTSLSIPFCLEKNGQKETEKTRHYTSDKQGEHLSSGRGCCQLRTLHSASKSARDFKLQLGLILKNETVCTFTESMRTS